MHEPFQTYHTTTSPILPPNNLNLIPAHSYSSSQFPVPIPHPTHPEAPQTQTNQTPHLPAPLMIPTSLPRPHETPEDQLAGPAGCRRLESVCDASHAQVNHDDHSSKKVPKLFKYHHIEKNNGRHDSGQSSSRRRGGAPKVFCCLGSC